MEDYIPFLFSIGIFLVAWLLAAGSDFFAGRFDKRTIVQPDVEYPNNHHVLGVGYYHATDHRWNVHPWNEYREGRGYYWDGIWHDSPDQRTVPKSLPSAAEVDRVNQEWRKAGPDRAQRFWKTVESNGFGTAIRRSEGS